VYSGMLDRAELRFHNAIKSEATRLQYDYALKKFCEYAKITQASGILQLKDEFLQEILEDYLIHLKKRELSLSTIKLRFAAVELFLSMNDKILNFKKIRKMFPVQDKKRTGERPWTNEEIKKMLEGTKRLRNKVIIHVLASTGCRIGGLEGLKIKHVEDMPDNCKSVLFYAGTNEEYVSFLTPEASKILEEYKKERRNAGELVAPESPLFREEYSVGRQKSVGMNLKALRTSMDTVVSKVRGRGEKWKRHDVQMNHGFRKRFDTILKNKENPNISKIERMMSHSSRTIPLDTSYYRPTTLQLFEEFKKAIFDLTIDDSERLLLERDENVKLKEEKDRVVIEKEEKQKELETRIKTMERLLSKIDLEKFEKKIDSATKLMERYDKSQKQTDGIKKLSEHNSNEERDSE
jgi:integrase